VFALPDHVHNPSTDLAECKVANFAVRVEQRVLDLRVGVVGPAAPPVADLEVAQVGLGLLGVVDARALGVRVHKVDPALQHRLRLRDRLGRVVVTGLKTKIRGKQGI